jgi:hypothetical protein
LLSWVAVEKHVEIGIVANVAGVEIKIAVAVAVEGVVANVADVALHCKSSR